MFPGMSLGLEEEFKAFEASLLSEARGIKMDVLEVDEVFKDWLFMMTQVFDLRRQAPALKAQGVTGKSFVEYANAFANLKESMVKGKIPGRKIDGTSTLQSALQAVNAVQKIHITLRSMHEVPRLLKDWADRKDVPVRTLGMFLFGSYLSLTAEFFMLFFHCGSKEGVPSMILKKMVKNVFLLYKTLVHFGYLWGEMDEKDFRTNVEERYNRGEFKRLEFFTVQTGKWLKGLTKAILRYAA